MNNNSDFHCGGIDVTQNNRRGGTVGIGIKGRLYSYRNKYLKKLSRSKSLS